MLTSVQTMYGQKVVSKSDTLNGHVVTTQMDSRVADLLAKSEESCNRVSGGPSARPSTNTSISSTGGDSGSTDYRPTTTTTTPSRINTSSMSTADICRRTPKLSGYRIQVAVTNSSAEANKIRMEVRQSFPDLRSIVDGSLRPNFKILAGSFFSKQSGQADLKRVKKSYGGAVLVQYSIFCVEAK